MRTLPLWSLIGPVNGSSSPDPISAVPGVWGHFAGSGDSPVDLEYIDGVLKELLATAAGP